MRGTSAVNIQNEHKTSKSMTAEIQPNNTILPGKRLTLPF